jgi:hypothetical protein
MLTKKIKGPWDKQTQEILGQEVELLPKRLCLSSNNFSQKEIESIIESSIKTIANAVWASARNEFEPEPDIFSRMGSIWKTSEIRLPKEEIENIIEDYAGDDIDSLKERVLKLEENLNKEINDN